MKRLSMARKNVYKRIKRANDKFKKMSKADKRVQIAKDVLLQLAAKRIKATPGTYVVTTFKKSDVKRFTETEHDEYGCSETALSKKLELQEVLRKQTCDACALGSMFLCAVDRHDKLKVKDLGYAPIVDHERAIDLNGDDLYNYLERFFSEDQLHDIENAFEGAGFGPARLYSDEENPRTRLRLIMQNIIDNKGTFVVEPLSDDPVDSSP